MKYHYIAEHSELGCWLLWLIPLTENDLLWRPCCIFHLLGLRLMWVKEGSAGVGKCPMRWGREGRNVLLS